MVSKANSKDVRITPQDLAQALRESLEGEAPKVRASDLLAWKGFIGLEADLRKALNPAWTQARYGLTGEVLRDKPLTAAQVRQAMGVLVSDYPELLREKEEGVGKFQEFYLKHQAKRLEACGTTWRGHVMRVFWRDAKGRERLRRQVGIHRCKGAWCPSCGRTRQAKIAGEVEKLLVLAEDWGFHAGHARLLTLTTPNGEHLPELRDQAHKAFHHLENSRWWKRHVFGFVRGSEVKTGEDGNWNFHIHFLVIFWSPKMDYAALNDHWTHAVGGRSNGRRCVVDVQGLEKLAWARKDGKEGQLARRNLVRAARYISKYLCKGEELANLKGGPGGLAHLVSSTKGMRRAGFGGGCSVLRRLAAVLMPKQLHAAEEALAEAPLHEGRKPVRVERMDPETGEVVDMPLTPQDDSHTRALKAWGEALETNPEPRPGWKLPARVVGVPCGPKGRHRRIGGVPLASHQPGVKEFEAWERNKAKAWPVTGVRAVVSEGAWKVFRTEHLSAKTGEVVKFAAVLPARRYTWRAVWAAIRAQLPAGVWAPIRAKANADHAREAIGSREREDARRAIAAALRIAHAEADLLQARLGSELRDARWQADTGGGEAARLEVARLESALRKLGVDPKSEYANPF